MKIEFREDGDVLIVDVSLNERRKASDPHEVVRTQQILDIMQDKGYNVGEYSVEKQSFCSTEGKNPSLSSTWILRKVKNERPVKSVKRPRTQRRKKTAAPKEDKLLGTKDLGGVQSQAQTNLSRSD